MNSDFILYYVYFAIMRHFLGHTNLNPMLSLPHNTNFQLISIAINEPTGKALDFPVSRKANELCVTRL